MPTYSILSLASGSVLESYRSEDMLLEAAYQICLNEPEARASLALATFDDDGSLVDSCDGDEMMDRLHTFAADHAATA
jgi:hypothetical protein